MTVESDKPRRRRLTDAEVHGTVRSFVAARADVVREPHETREPEDPRELREPCPELEQEFAAIYKREFPMAVAFARSYVNDETAEDAVQAVFMKYWEGYTLTPALVFRNDVEATHTAILNKVHNELRRLGRRLRTATRKAGIVYDEVVSVLRDASPVEVTDAEIEMSQVVGWALNLLPRRQREVFMLVKFDEKSYDEAAAILGISRITVHNQLVKANSRLRDLLQDHKIPQPDWWTILYSQPWRDGRKDAQE